MSRSSPSIEFSDTQAISALLTNFYPQLYRLTAALTGDTSEADRLTRTVLQRSLRQLPRWRDSADAERWFPHMAVLLARDRAADPKLASTQQAAGPGVLQHLTQVLATLPMQQREAVLLRYAEGFDSRRMATAMDCSATAATNHLAAGVHRLGLVVGERRDPFLQALPQMLASIVPPPGEVRLRVDRQIRRRRWADRMRRLLRWAIVLTLLAGAVAAWHWRGGRLW